MEEKLPISLGLGDVKRLLDQVDHSTPTGLRNRVAIELMLRCGLRVGEVSGLRRQDITWDVTQAAGKIAVRAGKGDKDRMVPADPGTMTWLRRWDGERNGYATTFLHTIKQGSTRPFSVRGIQAAVKKYVRRASLDADPDDVSPHTLRHTYATQLLDEGFTIREVQQMLGHKDVKTTQIYTHVVDAELEQKIAERRPLDGQRTMEGQPSAADLRLARLLGRLPAGEKEALGQMLVDQAQAQEEMGNTA